MPFRIASPRNIAFGSVCALALGSVSMVAPTPSHAGDGLSKLAIGAGIAVIANEIVKSNKSKKQKSKKTYKKKSKKVVKAGPRATIGVFKTTRAEVRDYQTRLNFLGHETGTPDGKVGKNTRKGVRAFQARLGTEQTGRLTLAEAAQLKTLTGTPTTHTGEPAQQQMAAAPAPQAPQQPANGFGMITQPVNGQTVVNSPIPMAPTMPTNAFSQQTALSAPNGGAAVTLDVFSMDQEPAGLGLKHTTSSFDILQVRTGDTLDAAKFTLASQGVTNCATSGQITTCSMQDNANDQFAIRALPDASGVPRITTLARHIHFDVAPSEQNLLSRLPESYDPLVAASDKVIGSDGCANTVGPVGYTGAKIFEASVHSEPAELTQMAVGCETFARLSMTGVVEGTVNDLYIVLFDGSALPKQAASTGLAKIKF